MDDFLATYQRMRNRGGNVVTAENALIENVNTDNLTGYVTISYETMGDNYSKNKNVVTLIVGVDTIIMDQFGQPLSFMNLREGMTVDAVFSAAMTRSIPPQARAFKITVIDENRQTNITEGRVMAVDTDNSFLYTGNPNDIFSQMRFVITDATTIRDRRGRRIRLSDLRPGEFVRVEHAIFQTLSIPPQTTAFNVQVL